MRWKMGEIAGPLMLVTAIGHAIVGVALFFEPLSGMAHDGFIHSIRPPGYIDAPDYDRISAFWFLLFSPVLFLLGQLTKGAVNIHDTRSLRLIGSYLVGIGIVGAAILPVSGNWFLIPLGALALIAANEISSDETPLPNPGGAPAA